VTARLPALDGLRAVAALAVVLTHAAYLTGSTVTGGLPGRLAGRGDYGVAIFCALSGFLLHHRFLAEVRDGSADVRGYLLRRAARVLPAYWLTLAVVVLATRPPVRTAIAQALAIQTYVPGTDLPQFSQSWSIPTELSFYAVLPLLVLGLERLRRRDPDLPVRVLVGSALLLAALLAVVPGGEVGSDLLVERWLPGRWPNFAVGMVLAEVLAHPGTRAAGPARRLARDTNACLAIGGAAFLLATTPIAGPLTLGPITGLQLSARLVLSTVVAGCLLAPLVLGRPDAWSGLMAARPTRWVGSVSYGLFLWHLPVFSAVYALSGIDPFSGGIVPLLVVGVPVSLALAWLSHVVVELPAMRAAGRWVRRRRTPVPR
jgi:peptidoglycan/LPS O-acetylase OafA/YrhL